MTPTRKRDPREGRRYRKVRATFLHRARAAGAGCWLAPLGHCLLDNAPIDWHTKGRTPTSPELDHALPCSTHPHLAYEESNFRVAHARCNQSRGAKDPLRPPMVDPAQVSAAPKPWIAAGW